MALRRCNALRNAALLALRWYVDTMPQAPLLRCFNHFFSRSRGPLLPARIVFSRCGVAIADGVWYFLPKSVVLKWFLVELYDTVPTIRIMRTI